MPKLEPDKYVLRLPDGLRRVIKIAAAENMRSMNAEIIFHLERIYRQSEATAQK